MDGVEYAVGFVLESVRGDETLLELNRNTNFGLELHEQEEHPPLPLKIAAAKVTETGGGYQYEFNDAITAQIQLQSLTVEPIDGYQSHMFSFAQNERVTTLMNNLSLNNTLYVYTGGTPENCHAQVTATFTLGDGQTEYQCHAIYMTSVVANQIIPADAVPTVEALNQELHRIAEEIKNSGETGQPGNDSTKYQINLAEEYTGTIQIPDLGRNGMVSLMGNNTTIHGDIDLDGHKLDGISNITFVPTTEQMGSAIHGGTVLGLSRCRISGYRIGVDSTNGHICMTDCVVTGNEIGYQLDSWQNVMDGNSNFLQNNHFCRNESAVKIVSVGEPFTVRGGSTFYLRFIDSEFYGNTVDFDVQHPGEYYFYRNYYGEPCPIHDSGAAARSRSAVVRAGNGVRVYVNPVRAAANGKQLVIDKQQPARIINGMSAEMMLDLYEDYRGTIDMVDWDQNAQATKVLATWDFGGDGN